MVWQEPLLVFCYTLSAIGHQLLSAYCEIESMKSISLVIALYNQINYTRRCIESIRECTAIPYELILVDNGCVDGTREYLRDVPATIITNPTNLGCARAWNQGIKAGGGQVIGILNNDIVVTPGWLEKLLAHGKGTLWHCLSLRARGAARL